MSKVYRLGEIKLTESGHEVTSEWNTFGCKSARCNRRNAVYFQIAVMQLCEDRGINIDEVLDEASGELEPRVLN